MKHSDDRGFTAIEIVLSLALVAAIGVAVFFAYTARQKADDKSAKVTPTATTSVQPTASSVQAPVATPVPAPPTTTRSKNGVTVTAPADGTTISGRILSISGKGPAGVNQPVGISVDGENSGQYYAYSSTPASDKYANADGTFVYEMNLNNAVIEDRTKSGQPRYKLSAGTHTFTFNYGSFDAFHAGPTISVVLP